MKFLQRSAVAFVMLAMASVCFARSWQVNNNPNVIADFTDINAAMSSADVVAGDTLYIGAGCVIQSAQTISKTVTVIGAGWNYSDSPIIDGRINSNLTITAAGVKVLGLWVTGWIKPCANDITIERCRFSSLSNWGREQYIYNVKILSSYTGRIHANINYTKYNIGWEIIGNVIVCNEDNGALYGINTATVENNVIIYKYNSNRGVFTYAIDSNIKNNIIIYTEADKINDILYGCDRCVFNNNVLSASSGYEGNMLLGSNDITTVFKCTGSVVSGEYYSLKEGSPAIGAGEGGIDCGAMVGAYKFVPFGRPDNIPVIKELVVPSTPTNGEINVTVGF